MPVVSVIVPIYGVEAYLPTCIKSVLSQTYSDFELILVDDGSPDHCGEICDAYAKEDARIRVIHKKNGGLSDARNAGLDESSGKYVFFLDSDDCISPALLETAIPYMELGYELTAFTLQGFYDDGTVQLPWKRKSGTFVMNTPEERKNFIHREIVQAAIGWEACTRIFVREIIERYHLRFVDNRKIFAEDMYFSLCYCAHIKKAISLDDCLYYYRQRRNSIMGQQMGKNNVIRIEQLAREVLKHYQQSDDCALLAEDFSLLHLQIIMNQFIFQIQYVEDPVKYRENVISSLENWTEIEEMVRYHLRNPSEIRKYYGPVKRVEIIRNAAFLLGGPVEIVKVSNWIIQKIRNQQERLERLVPENRK